MFGIVHYENESGEVTRAICQTEGEYFRHLEIGRKWMEAEPGRRLEVWGERGPEASVADAETGTRWRSPDGSV